MHVDLLMHLGLDWELGVVGCLCWDIPFNWNLYAIVLMVLIRLASICCHSTQGHSGITGVCGYAMLCVYLR